MTTHTGSIKSRWLFEVGIVRQAMLDSFIKLDPRHQVSNPVMFVVWVGSVLTSLLFLQCDHAQHLRSIRHYQWGAALFRDRVDGGMHVRGEPSA